MHYVWILWIHSEGFWLALQYQHHWLSSDDREAMQLPLHDLPKKEYLGSKQGQAGVVWG